MTKVSKNLKRIRTAKQLSQDALAGKLYVTRQTVSGWENGRTQPDIETLVKIAQVLEVDVEELIYGVKKNSGEDVKKQNTRRVLTTVFAVIAAVLMGAGLILVFVTGWKKFPDALKAVLAFVPILVGQAAAVFTYLKHKDSVAWREGASVLWCAGIAATVALVDNVFNLNGGMEKCLFVDALMFLPVIYVLDAVMPLIVYYLSAFVFGMYSFENQEQWITPFIMILLFAVGVVYVIINRKKTDDIRHIFSRWLSVIMAYAVVFINGLVLGAPAITLFISMAFFLALYISDNSDIYFSPCRTIGVLGSVTVSVASVVLFSPSLGGWVSEKYRNEAFIFAVVGVVMLAVAVIKGKKSFIGNTIRIGYCIFAAVIFALEAIASVFVIKDSVILYVVFLICALGMSITLIAKGALAGKFAPLNLGLIATAVQIAFMIMSLVEIGMFTAGILLIVFGVIMFTVNFLLAKRIKPAVKEEGGIICVRNQD